MKALGITLLSCLFFIAATAHADSPLVVDSDGDPLQPGVGYHVKFFLRPGGGGGLSVWSNGTCPYSVIQTPFESMPGIPITFTPMHPIDEGGIPESSGVYIKFEQVPTVVPRCPGDTFVWKVNMFESLGEFRITTGGKVGDFRSQFKLEKFGRFAYKFVSCFTIPLCRNVGRVLGDGPIRLVLNNNDDDMPFGVVFFKANSTLSATQVAK